MGIPFRSGAAVPLLLMLPNIAWLIWSSGDGRKQSLPPPFLALAENIGRIALLVLPFFYSLKISEPLERVAAVAMALFLAIYYACWIRYFTNGRAFALLAAPILGIPLPMAVAPVFFLILSSYLMGAWPMALASVWFGGAHIWVSSSTLQPCRRRCQ